ncbi:hypothetical protein GCM10011538_03120 [Ligilactobacillus murinus]|uniref:restriction endonuclease subunit S n=1 Tax=Ligilactobacillus murinus TaxID=1622 RepID=UPI0031CEDFDF
MAEEKKNIPKLRFREFTGDNANAWELRRADEIFKTISDKGHPDLTVLSASQEHGMIPRNDVGVDIKYDKKNTANYKRVKPEQFVIHLRSFQGGFAWSEIEGITSPAYTVLDYKETGKYSFDFWKEVLTSPNFIKRLESVTYGIRDGRSISFSDFSTLKFSSPEIREQQKIGSFFKHLDELITLHQRMLDEYKTLKKTMLSKMFPKNGEKYPELRFSGFTDAWELRKFENFVKKSGAKNKNGGNFPAYSVSNTLGLVPQTEQFEESRLSSLEKKDYRIVRPDEFAYNPARINVGSIAFNNTKKTVIVSSLYVILKMSEVLDNEFVLQFIKSDEFLKDVKRKTEGSVREYLFFANFKNINFPYISNLKEQQKIGSFFRNLDELITLHQRELELLKTLKKTMLQQMFV